MERCEKILEDFGREDDERMGVEGSDPIKQYSQFAEKPFIKNTQKISFSIDNLLAKSGSSSIKKCSEHKLNDSRKVLKNSENTMKSALNSQHECSHQEIYENSKEISQKSDILTNIKKASNLKYSKTVQFLNFDSPTCSGFSSFPKDFSKTNLEPPKPETICEVVDEKFSIENDNDYENSTRKSDNVSEISMNNSDLDNEDYDAILANQSSNSFVKFSAGTSSSDLVTAERVSAIEYIEESGEVDIEDDNYGKN